MQNKTESRTNGYTDTSFFDKKSMFVYDFNSLQIVDANPHAVQQYGYTKDELTKLKIGDLGEKVVLSDLDIRDVSQSNIYPKELWRHKNKEGKTWFVQVSTQNMLHDGCPVQLATVHNIDNLVKGKSLDFRKMPRIDLMWSQMPFGMIEWSRDLVVRDFSEKAEIIFGRAYNDVVGKSITELSFICDDILASIKNHLVDDRKQNSNYFTMESVCDGIRGKNMVYLWHNSIVRNEYEEIASVYSLIEDITDKRMSDLELRKSESKFRVMSEQSFGGIFILDGARFSYVNPRMCEITGYSEQELTEELSIQNLIHPGDFVSVNRQVKQWKKENKDSFETSLKIISKSKDVLHIKTYGSAIQSDGQLEILGVVIDETSEVKAFENYTASEQSYQSLFDSVADEILILDKDGHFIDANKNFEEMYGYKKEELIGKDPSFLAAPSKVDMEETMQIFQKAVDGEVQEFRWWGKRKDGEIFPKDIKLTKGQYFGDDVVIAVSRDITEAVRREEELRHNKELFEQLFSNSPLGIVLLDRESMITQVNHSFESLFGYENEEIKGANLDELVVPESELEDVRDLSGSTETFTLTKKRKTSSGELLDVFIVGVPVLRDGEQVAMYGMYMDITDRIEAEERIKKSLEEKKILLAEIHHRVKNNLAVITGLLELQYHNMKGDEAKNALRDSQLRVNSMSLIHEKLYQNESLSDIDFENYISDLVEVIVSSHKKSDKDVTINTDAVPMKLSIKQAIPCGLIINEIVTNSMKYAFPDDHSDPTIQILGKRTDGRATIEVSDNGVGLPEPFEELETDSLGTLLIKTLASQLDADLSVEVSEGTKYILSFNLGEDK